MPHATDGDAEAPRPYGARNEDAPLQWPRWSDVLGVSRRTDATLWLDRWWSVARLLAARGPDTVTLATDGVLATVRRPNTPPSDHPATFSPRVLAEVDRHLPSKGRLLDPFAGVGGVLGLRDLGYAGEVWCGEIEPEWAADCARRGADGIHLGDSRAMPFPDASFDHAVTSPCYGNRMGDTYAGRPGETKNARRTYRTSLGRLPAKASAGRLQWGSEYRDLHRAVWQEVHRVLRPGALFLLNVKDHIRSKRRDHIRIKRRVRVSLWHHLTLQGLGFEPVAWVKVPAKGMRYGQNYERRVDHEVVAVYRKGS